MKVLFGSYNPWEKPRWEMVIDLKELCELEGKKEENNKGKRVLAYPKGKLKKLFKLMIQNILDENELDEIQKYLKDHSRGYEKVFCEIRQKIGR